MSDLSVFLLARIAEDEAAARDAIDPERPGATWQWVTAETDVPVKPGDEGEALGEQNLSLRTVDEFPTRSVGSLPGFLIWTVEEGEPGALRHIARFDPARVLAECEAKRRIVELCEQAEEESARGRADTSKGAYWGLHDAVRALVAVYADHEDFKEAWR